MPEAEEEAKKRIRYTVRRYETTVFPRPRQPLRLKIVTYQVEGYPPRTIEIPEAEWSLEEEQKRIREDFKRWTEEVPETYEIEL